MTYNSLYQQLKAELEEHISFRVDKPEETADSTLKALWQKAQGNSMSAEEAVKHELQDLNKDEEKKLKEYFSQRISGKPLSYILERQSFLGIELICDSRALIPRKETEILGKKALEIGLSVAKTQSEIKILDVCCGSGNLGIALAKNISNSIIYSSDLSLEAVNLTRENVHFHHLESQIKVSVSDLFQNFESDAFFGKIDLIVCNPPYISSSKVTRMDREISDNEPLMAFDGGMIGLSIIQKLIREAPRFLASKGWLVFEIGLGQGPFIMQLCEKSMLYRTIESVLDEKGNARVVVAQIA